MARWRGIALETSGRTGSVAALEGTRVVAERSLDPTLRSAQSLAPGLQRLLADLGWPPEGIDLVALPVGPGSFTGLRVGVTTAKVFAYAVGADVIGLDTLQVIAVGSPDTVQDVEVAMDAQRGQLFAARFRRGDAESFEFVRATELIDTDRWVEMLEPGSTVTGPALAKLAARLPASIQVVPPQYWHPTATGVGRLAIERYAAGQRDDLWRLVPRYYRLSAAEEKWAERQRSDGV